MRKRDLVSDYERVFILFKILKTSRELIKKENSYTKQETVGPSTSRKKRQPWQENTRQVSVANNYIFCF
jgi:hypothetical protein